jgi:glyoxylase-like metal-dependent hydrolase (beta-lactamase superfamily II)
VNRRSCKTLTEVTMDEEGSGPPGGLPAGGAPAGGPHRRLPVVPDWFEIGEAGDGVYRITEPHAEAYVRANAWLVRGTSSHVLVDTGLGIGGLAVELARTGLLDRPVIAVATHAHFDHFGGLAEFADRAAHPDDGGLIETASDYVTLVASTYPADLVAEFGAAGLPVPDLLVDALPRAGFDLDGFRTPPAGITRWLTDGDVLDLGGRSLEVMHTPGHSPGSICLWEEESGTLLSGDVLVDGEPLLDQLPRSSPADFAASLRRLAGLPLSAVYGGHGPVFGRRRAHEIITDYLAASS